LIWEPNTEKDLAGYLVLRGESGGPLSPLTKEPIQETTYRDTTVRPGTTYEYAVVAVDNAPTPNRSDYSNRVTEVAR
jgi:fibronectin type 3 domain-containing protein